MGRLTQTSAWLDLARHRQRLDDVHLRTLFDQDPERFERLHLQLDDLLFDFSKNRATEETFTLLLALAREAELEVWRDKLFSGARINNTERRAALHVALRNRSGRPILLDGEDVMPAVERVLDRMRLFTEQVRDGTWLGATGEAISDIVHIGIGGSSLGPEMATAALKPYHRKGLRAHFVANVDSADLADTLGAGLDPRRTLFIVASKSFATQETMANAAAARAWLVGHLGETAVPRHFVAASTNLAATAAFGIEPEQVFEFWDWVGGRYSLWSAIGLPVALAIGYDNFADLLAGAHEMDEHFRHAPLGENMPVVLGLLGLWYRNFWGVSSYAVVPYDERLRRLPAYLQQLEMESNGKAVSRDGAALDYATSPVVWGEPGTNGQHAFFQLLHQGSDTIPVDFLVAAEAHERIGEQHDLLVANCLAQAEALMRGRSEEEARAALSAAGVSGERLDLLGAHKRFAGNRPSNLFLYRKLTPRTLGRLLALYEHKVFVQGVLWGLNSFDQWGVELGKELADDLFPAVRGERPAGARESSTLGLLAHLHRLRGQTD